MIRRNVGQDGSISIFVICCLAIMVTITAAIYCFSRLEMQTRQRFITGWRMKYGAQDGIQRANRLINEKEEIYNTLNNQKGIPLELFNRKSEENEYEEKVYAKLKGEEIIVLSIARQSGVSYRVVAYFKKIGSGKYEIIRLEK